MSIDKTALATLGLADHQYPVAVVFQLVPAECQCLGRRGQRQLTGLAGQPGDHRQGLLAQGCNPGVHIRLLVRVHDGSSSGWVVMGEGGWPYPAVPREAI